MNWRKYLCLLLTFIVGRSYSQQLLLTYDEAIQIALNKGYTIQTYDNKRMMNKFWYSYNKAMFKPRLDLDFYAPSWNESVQTISRVDGLPVYNSTGSMKIGGKLEFTYILPSGGNLSLLANSYFDDQQTILDLSDNEKLKNKLFYNRFAIGFSQPVFTANLLKENLKRAELEFEKSTKQYTRGQMDIIHEVTNGFYVLYRAIKLVEIAEQRIVNSKEAYRVASLKAESGRIPKGDLLTVEVEVAQDEADLLASIGQLEREEDSFKQLIGVDLSTDIGIRTDIIQEHVIVDETIALREALANRLELEEANIDIELQRIEVSRAQRTREFKGTISGFYDFTGVSTTGKGSLGSLIESSINNLNDRPPNRGVVFTLSYPISDWGRGKAKVQEAEIGLDDKILRLDNIRVTIAKEVRDIVRTVRQSQSKLLIHEKNKELALRSYNIFIMRFENGDISSQELAIERERLSTIQLNYLNAYIDYKLALSNLKRKTMWDFKNNRSYRITWNNKELSKKK